MNLNLFSAVNTLGYGVHGNNIIKALIENGQEISLTNIGDVQLDPFFKPYVEQALNKRFEFNNDNPSLFVFHSEFSNQASGLPLYTFEVFETTTPKENSLKILNNGPTDTILTTTKEHADILQNYTSKSIEVVPEGADDTIFNTIPVDPYIKTDKFTYITCGKREERKNTDLILRLFIDKMKDKNVALIVHTFNPFLNQTKDHPFTNLACWCGVNPTKKDFEYKEFDGKAHKFTYKECDIYFTVPTIPVSMMSSLYHSANIGIQCSRSEGWDLPAIELLACGVPTIITDCMGHNEYIHNTPDIQKELIIKKDTMSIANDGVWFKGKQGNWDDLNIIKFNNKLEETYNNSHIYTNKDEDLADYISANFSWNNTAKILIDLFTKNKG